jgi:hypothetical protein
MIWVALGGVFIAGPWWLYEMLTWGSPLGPRVAQNIPGLGGEQMLTRLGDTTGHNEIMLWPIDGTGQDVLMIVLIGAVALGVGLWLLSRLRPSAAKLQASGFWLLTLLLMAIVAISTWRVTQELRPNDLLTTFPFMLLLLVPMTSQTTHHVTRLLASAALAYVTLVLIVSPFEGGIQWGPRFLLPAIVPLAVVIVARLDRTWRTLGRGQRVGLGVLFSVCLIAGGYST